MSIIFLLLLLISSCTSVSYSKDDKDDGEVLLRIKEQLGNPRELGSWVKGSDFCHWPSIMCTSTSRVNYLVLGNYGTNLSAPFPPAVCDLTELIDLTVFRVMFYGPIPSCINRLTNLIRLYIAETKLSGPLPGFPFHQKLNGITISGNQISGSIPSSLSTLPNLMYLDLSSNYLTGAIPPGLVHNSSSVLLLFNNSLTGEIPKCYGWVDFNVFHVGENQLSGDASFLFGNQKPAYAIFLSSNQFEFDLSNVQIPQNLSVLDLGDNKIWGKVPDSLASADRLYYLNLSYNKLCGEIPQGGQLWRFNANSYVNNACLCGKPLQPCFAALAPAPAPISVTPLDSTP
jgi:Leucine rich repeat N-terminal domain